MFSKNCILNTRYYFMRDVILNFPNQIKEGVRVAGNFRITKKYDRIVICGMGGSAIPGMIFLTWQERQNKGPGVPIMINSNYGLPSDISTEDLVICISWSGATEETTSALKSAINKHIDSIVITNPIHPEDKLAQLAQQNNIKILVIPFEEIPPRFAVGYMTAVLFTILGLESHLVVEPPDENLEQQGKDLADKIGDKIPIFYSSYSWRKLGSFWKVNFNETSKVPAYWNYLPAMSHGELEMYARPNLPFYPIIFVDKNDNPEHVRDINATIAILNKQEYNYSIIELNSFGNPIETILNNYILGLWANYYLAQKLGADPVDIKLIEEFKALKSLKNK